MPLMPPCPFTPQEEGLAAMCAAVNEMAEAGGQEKGVQVRAVLPLFKSESLPMLNCLAHSYERGNQLLSINQIAFQPDAEV